ncbi:MAG: type VI secretion protein ImpA [Acidocella sp. 20-57-95]|nr:MAG: type VI secretion protein ImpA [Acidocella sp. 20-57-95]OYV62521.1 MAG: type VI secretion protein ImpA [Acidocella sp. 21-58-7]HQT63789.1 type VI secretion system protein TssA [Acidocella sp.]HQU03193.1 type VI secretion system protein TssA [Acidocella sp.]
MVIDGLELENLLAPIAGDLPSGIDIRNDFSPASLYFRLRDARSEARAAERAADANPGSEAGVADGWRTVRATALKILTEHSKDLEVAAWLTEALVRSDGLVGLCFGAQLIEGLASGFWDQLYPMPDEDGIATRVAPVTGLNGEGGDGTLIQPLQKLKLFNGPTGEPLYLFQYEQSAELATITDEKRIEGRLKAGVLPFATVEAAARAAGSGVFVGLNSALQEALAAWRAMGETLDRLAGPDSPPTRRVADVLENLASIIKPYLPPDVGAAAEVTQPEAADAVTGDGGGAKRGKLATREDALHQLSEIAAFFKKNEPQSPMAYTLEDAIRRGRMSWPELLKEVVRDESLRNNILTGLGIQPG